MYENVWWPIYIPDKDPFSIDFIDFYLPLVCTCVQVSQQKVWIVQSAFKREFNTSLGKSKGQTA